MRGFMVCLALLGLTHTSSLRAHARRASVTMRRPPHRGPLIASGSTQAESLRPATARRKQLRRRQRWLRRWRAEARSKAAFAARTQIIPALPDEPWANGSVTLLRFLAPGGHEWCALGPPAMDRTLVARWLHHEALRGELAPWPSRGTDQPRALELDEIAPRVHEMRLPLTRASLRRLRRLWDSRRLLLQSVRLKDVARWVALYRASHRGTRAPPAALRQRLAAREFERELVAYIGRAHALVPRAAAEVDALLAFVDSSSPVAPHALRPSAPGAAPSAHAESLVAWTALLAWFRERFPYDRADCARCTNTESGDAAILGNTAAPPAERALGALRTELQYCGACATVSRFPRYNEVATILQERRGRCGEYASALYSIALALGWSARLVVDWTDHIWVEIYFGPCRRSDSAASLRCGIGGGGGGRAGSHDARPEEQGARAAAARVEGGGRQCDDGRWVALDPCEAAVDSPGLYASWGKIHTYVVAIGGSTRGESNVADVTATYAADMGATRRARELSDAALRDALERGRRRARSWRWEVGTR